MRTLLLAEKRSFYGGYPVTRQIEKLDTGAASLHRSQQEHQTRESHPPSPGNYSGPSKSDTATKLRKSKAEERHQKGVDRKAKTKPDPFSILFANPENAGQANSPNIPGAHKGQRLDYRSIQGNSDTMGMIHTGAVDLRRVAKDRKAKGNWCPQNDLNCAEGGELTSNEGAALFGHPFHGRRPGGPATPVTWGGTRGAS